MEGLYIFYNIKSGRWSTIASISITHKLFALFQVATDRVGHFLAVPGQISYEVPLQPWAACTHSAAAAFRSVNLEEQCCATCCCHSAFALKVGQSR